MERKTLILLKGALLTLLILISLMIPKQSFSYMRDADLFHSRDSLRVGWIGDLSLCVEKMIDKKSSFGFYYMPYLSGFNAETFEFTYNIQISTDEAMYSAFYTGIYSTRMAHVDPDNTDLFKYWRTFYYPEIGFAFKFKIDEKWDFRMEILYFLPTKLEFDYSINKNMELSIGISQTGIIGFNYIF